MTPLFPHALFLRQKLSPAFPFRLRNHKRRHLSAPVSVQLVLPYLFPYLIFSGCKYMIFLSNLQILEQQIQKKPIKNSSRLPLLCAADKTHRVSLFSAQPIKNSSRVPRYQNPLKVVGFCDFQVASPPYREGPWGGWMFFSFFSCAKKRTSICFFLCARESKRTY